MKKKNIIEFEKSIREIEHLMAEVGKDMRPIIHERTQAIEREKKRCVEERKEWLSLPEEQRSKIEEPEKWVLMPEQKRSKTAKQIMDYYNTRLETYSQRQTLLRWELHKLLRSFPANIDYKRNIKKKEKILVHLDVKDRVRKLKALDSARPLSDIFYTVADDLNKTHEAVQRDYYYRGKKLQKKVT